jgi:geranylgeranyl reductase family protein
MEKHEVVIVGAGPAGLKAGELLAKANKDVLIIERKKEKDIGDKVCAGALAPHSMRYFPPEIYERVFDSMTMWVGNRKIKVEIGEPLLAMISRREIGQYQLKLAKENGAQLMTDTSVRGLNKEKNEVVLEDDSLISYEYLIAADGSNSTTRRSMGFKGIQLTRCIEVPVKGNFDKMITYFDLKKYGLTYYWIFPHKGYASIGTCVLRSLIPMKEMKNNFFKWAENKGLDFSKTKMRSCNIHMGYDGFRHENIFLTGDAASFACTVNGEGIYQAIRSGEIAAKAIIEPKWNYKGELNELLRFHKYGSWALPFLTSFPGTSRRIISKFWGGFMPLISTMLSTAFSFKFAQRYVFREIAK